MQIEMQKLREELLKSRRAESAREREVTFLQQQLTEAAKRIVELTRGGGSGRSKELNPNPTISRGGE